MVSENGGSGAHHELFAAAPLKAGAVAIAGHAESTTGGSSDTPSLVVYEASGTLRFSRRYAANSARTLRSADNLVVAVGWESANTVARTSLVMAFKQSTGALAWQRVGTPIDQQQARAGLASNSGGTVAGDGWHQGRRQVYVERLTSVGQKLWRRHIGASDLNAARLSPNGLIRWSSGYVLAGAWINSAGADVRPLLIRTDTGGYYTCKDAGTCAPKTTQSCDDGKACTADWCDAAQGCKHMAIAGCKP